MAGRILIADDVATNRIVLKVNLMEAFYEVSQASGGAETIARARKELPDLILLDLLMPDMNGIEVCNALKSDPLTSSIPIIVVTAQNDSASRLEALRAGADDFMIKPLNEQTLLARVRSLLRARDTNEELRLRDNTSCALGFGEDTKTYSQPATIAVIAGQFAVALEWKNALSQDMSDNFVVFSKETALLSGHAVQAPDVYIIACDLDKPDEGLRLLSELRSRPKTRHSAILMVVPRNASHKASTALDLGANDLMIEGFDSEEMALRLKTQIRRKRQSDRLRETVRDGLRMAVIDPLTGLYNRRYAEPHLQQISQRAQKTGRAFAVMILDLDHFKTINDTYGHSSGDSVLQEVATRIKDNLRAVDMVARIGGEEFLVVMPDTQLEQARLAAERLCHVVGKTPVQTANGKTPIPVSISIGVSMGGGAGQHPKHPTVDRYGGPRPLYGQIRWPKSGHIQSECSLKRPPVQPQKQAFFIVITEKRHRFRFFPVADQLCHLGHHHLRDKRQVKVAHIVQPDPLQMR